MTWSFTPFWRLTRWGFITWGPCAALTLQRGCDEWHNKSRFIIIPLLGEFVLWGRGYSTEGPVHLHAHGPDGWEGADVPGCEICAEMKADLEID